VVFVERDRAALDALASNLSASKLEGTVRAEEVESYLESAVGRFDIVFVDPPFATSLGSITAVMELLVPLLEDDARVILQRRSGDPDPEWPSALRVDGHRRYGDSALWQLRKGMEEA
jgi:16S rRNA (guanine966-N2)-methyltransferase